MIFKPDIYYVGDPGFVLPNDDLRMLFAETIKGELKSGTRELVTSYRCVDDKMVSDLFWFATTPTKAGTIYSQDGKSWGFDWGCFGMVPWKWIEHKSSYEGQKFNFTEPFTCSFTEDSITIGHLHFTFNPK